MVRDYLKEKGSPDYVNAGSNVVNFEQGICIINFALSFDIVWGRHLDFSEMGALEVSEYGELANWIRGSIGRIGAVITPTVMGAVAQHYTVSIGLVLAAIIGSMMIPAILCGPETAMKRLEDIVQ